MSSRIISIVLSTLLLICFKGFTESNNLSEWKKIINFKFIEFREIDEENDFDIFQV